eukprot:gb/GEZJ01007363.1/.p1 GENE.gb/GEZJ01007363.1/~~gb/GEZJ01007363.1/.p1  ORF type:complete len:205 (-),score=27.38 gb/GEZJ01007363.1/:67-681(-)
MSATRSRSMSQKLKSHSNISDADMEITMKQPHALKLKTKVLKTNVRVESDRESSEECDDIDGGKDTVMASLKIRSGKRNDCRNEKENWDEITPVSVTGEKRALLSLHGNAVEFDEQTSSDDHHVVIRSKKQRQCISETKCTIAGCNLPGRTSHTCKVCCKPMYNICGQFVLGRAHVEGKFICSFDWLVGKRVEADSLVSSALFC